MNNNDLVAKLWKLCDNLRDGGVSYQNYVNELASLLFLKMCKETGQEAEYLPEGYRWDDLKSRIGQEQLQFYRKMLVHLGEDDKKVVHAVFIMLVPPSPSRATTALRSAIWIHWTGTTVCTVSRAMTSAICTKGCCRRTPMKRSLVRASTSPRVCLLKPLFILLKPQPREVVQDPAAGTAGFLIEADRYVKSQTNDLDDLDGDTRISRSTARLSASNWCPAPVVWR